MDGSGHKQDCNTAAAQATIDQASYAYWQTWIGLGGAGVGLLTLVAAIAAALYARNAAEETRRGADAAIAALKPHLVATCISAALSHVGTIEVWLTNRGGSAATAIKGDLWARIYMICPTTGSEKVVRVDQRDRDIPVSPLPAQGDTVRDFGFVYGEQVDELIDALEGRSQFRLLHLDVEVRLRYKWAFGDGENVIVATIMKWAPHGGKRIFPGELGWLSGETKFVRELDQSFSWPE